MRTIIAGSRGLWLEELFQALEACPWSSQITSVVSGVARGIDEAGEEYAFSKRLPVDYYPANWALHGRKAGFIRNKLMAKNADALLAVWDGRSRGTKHMIDIAKERGLKSFVFMVEP